MYIQFHFKDCFYNAIKTEGFGLVRFQPICLGKSQCAVFSLAIVDDHRITRIKKKGLFILQMEISKNV